MKPYDYDQLRSLVPSAFAESEAEHLSDRYTFINSFNVVQEFEKEGFFPVFATQSFNTIDSDHGKHMIRFRHADQLTSGNKQGVSEIVLKNSHNGKSKLQLFSGVFRQVCSNGLIAFSQQGGYAESHGILTIESVMKGLESTIDFSQKTIQQAETMQGIELQQDQRYLLAELAKLSVYSDREIDSALLLKPRRSYDTATDLWTTFNVIQENIMKGGIEAVSDSGNNSKTRPITAIDKNVSVNQALWQVADDFLLEIAA